MKKLLGLLVFVVAAAFFTALVFIVAAESQMMPFPGPGGVANTCGGPKTIFTASPSGNANNAGNSLRVVANSLSSSTGCNQVRVTLASGSGSMVVNNVSIGVQVSAGQTVATPTELLYSGGHGFSIGSSTSIVSDWASITMPGASNLIVVVDCGSPCNNGATATSIEYFLSGATYNQANPGGLSNAAQINSITKIEVQ